MQFWQLTGLFLTSFVCKNALIIFVCIRFVVKTCSLAGFGGLVKRKQKIAEAIVRGHSVDNCLHFDAQKRSVRCRRGPVIQAKESHAQIRFW